MRPAGPAAVERAKADGRWEAAYAGQATIEVPADLAAALTRSPRRRRCSTSLEPEPLRGATPVEQAKRAETRARRIEQFTAMLARGETLHPQKRTRPG